MCKPAHLLLDLDKKLLQNSECLFGCSGGAVVRHGGVQNCGRRFQVQVLHFHVPFGSKFLHRV